MNVYTILKEGTVVGVFTDDQKVVATNITYDIGGKLKGPFILNKIHVDVPLDGKSYYLLTMMKAGNFKISTLPTLTEDGQRRQEEYYLETYSKDRRRFKKKSHWRLLVHCYAKSEDDAKEIATNVRNVLEKDPKLAKGTSWRDLTTGEELD